MRSVAAPVMRLVRSRIAQLMLIFVVALTTMAAGDTGARFENIGHKMVCTCGCGQILLECNHVGCPNSEGMIQELRQQLAGGSTDTSIFNAFMAKYGPTVLAAPIRGGFDNAAWIVPIVVFLFATLGTGLLIRRWRTRSVPALAIAGFPSAGTDAMRERIRRETEF